MDLTTLALDAAQAGAAAIDEVVSGDAVEVRTKSGPGDFVTSADHAAERAILATIRAQRPDDAVLAEESGAHRGTGDIRWIVDPLDGTANFVHGRDDYAVAVAAMRGEEPLAGAIVRPAYGDWVCGGPDVARGSTGRPRASASDTLGAALISVSIAGQGPAERLRNFSLLSQLMPHVRDFRRSGSSSCDFFALATGALDGLVTINTKPWDLYPGVAVLLAAGGRVVTSHLSDGRDAVVAGAPAVVEQLAELLANLPLD